MYKRLKFRTCITYNFIVNAISLLVSEINERKQAAGIFYLLAEAQIFKVAFVLQKRFYIVIIKRRIRFVFKMIFPILEAVIDRRKYVLYFSNR